MQHRGFEHVGRVISIEERGADQQRVVTVAIDSVAACEGCKARSQCVSMGSGSSMLEGESGAQRRLLRVECDGSECYSEGDMVDVSMAYNIGVLAVVVAYVVPLIIFIGMLVVLIGLLDIEQGVAALTTFATLALYYLGVYAMRNYFESVVTFKLRKK